MSPRIKRAAMAYGFSLGVIALASLVAGLLLPYFSLVNIVMILVLAVVFVAFFTGRGPSVLASLLGMVAFAYFYIPPRFVLTAEESQYLLTLFVMLVLSLLISGLTARWREKALEAAAKQREQATLYRFTRELAAEPQSGRIANLIAAHLAETWGGEVVLFQPEGQGEIEPITPAAQQPVDLALVRSVWASGVAAPEVPDQPIVLPLQGVEGPVALAAFVGPDRELLHQGRELLAAMLTSGALALERARFGAEAEAARMHVEAERLRNSLLSAVSHDLRTPLAIIVGASSSLTDTATRLTPEARQQMTRVVYDEASRMRELVENLLDMARLEAGPVALNREWQAFEEVLGVVLKHMRPRMGGRELKTTVPHDLPLLRFDSALIERVLVNLLENTTKYTPGDARIVISACDTDDGLQVCVSDNGPGLGDNPEQVFSKFWRAKPEGTTPGVGLGLSICRSIIEAHGGRIWAENRPGGGASFCFSLPRAVDENPAAMPTEAV